MRTHIVTTIQVLILGAFALWIAPAAATAEADDTPAGSPPATATRVATVEGITEYRLDNGLRFLLSPDRSQQQFTVNITYLVGGRHEGYGETGMAHLLEHLVVKRTANHPDILSELSERGAAYNATTFVDRTSYYETFPADEDNLAWALDLEADRMVNANISAEDLGSEMTVVRNEWEHYENSPFTILKERVLSTAFLWHNYGNTTIGARADFENVPIDRLQAFYRKYYQPDNAVLVVAGRFDPERAVDLIEEKFGPIPRPNRSGANRLYETYTVEPTQDGERTVTLRRVGDVQIALAAYHVPSGSHEQFAAIEVLAHLLGTQPAGRLYKNVVKTGLAADTSISTSRWKEPGVLLAGAEVRREGDLGEAVEALLATLQDLADEPPTAEEVDRAKAELAAGVEHVFNDPDAIGGTLGHWAAVGDWRLMFLHRDRVAEVTPDDVLAVAKAYLKTSNRTVGYFYPTDETPPRAEIPASPDVAALVAGYTGGRTVAEGEAFEPTPANIEVRTTRLTLASGVEVALLPKESRDDAVSVSFSFRHGTEDALMGRSTAAESASIMLTRGTTRRSHQEVGDELLRLKTTANLIPGATAINGSATTVRESLPEVLRLVAESLREPAFDRAEFELLRENVLAGIEARRSDVMERVENAVNRHVNSGYDEGHVFYTPTSDEEIARWKAVTVEQARDFWASFYGAEGGTVAIVGDFDPDVIVPVLEEALGGWSAREPYARVHRAYADVPAVAVDIEMPDKANAGMVASLRIRMRDDNADYPALVLVNHILGSRLFNRIREREGLSYAVGSQFGADPIDEIAAFFGHAIFAPENADRVVSAFREELDRALTWGFTAEEVEAARRGYQDGAQRQRSSDEAVASILNYNLFLGRTMEFVAQQEAAIEALTPDDLLLAMRRHIDPEKMSIFRAGDFANNPAR